MILESSIWIRKYLYLSVLFALAFSLGVWGFLLVGQTPVDAVYNTLRLIVLETSLYSSAETINWALQVARFALPLFAATALVGFMLTLAGQQLVYLKLAVRPAKTVFLGSVGPFEAMLNQYVDSGGVLIFDAGEDASCEVSPRAKPKKGVSRLPVKNVSSGLLRKLKINRAEQVFIASRDDGDNLLRAKQVIGAISEKQSHLPRLIVEINDSVEQQIASRDPVFLAYRRQGGDMVWFNAKAQAARLLLLQAPPLTKPSLQSPGSLHIAIFGLEELSHALILQIVRHCVYLDDSPIVLDIFSADENGYRQFLDAHPLLDHSSDDPCFGGVKPNLELRHFPFQAGSANPSVVRRALSSSEGGPGYRRIYVTESDDYACLYLGAQVRQTLLAMGRENSVVACLPGNVLVNLEQAKNYQQDNVEVYGELKLFHCSASLFHSGEVYPGRFSDDVGLMVHAAYSVVYREPILSPDQPDFGDRFRQRIERYFAELEAQWEQRLDDVFRWSSRHSGDHLFVKLRELGFALEERQSDSDRLEDGELISELELAIEQRMPELILLEHRRFCAERLVDGWLYAPESNKPLRLNHTLVPFDELSESEKNKDEVVIRVVPLILRSELMRKRYRLVKLAAAQ